MNNNKQIKIGAVLSYLQMALGVIVSLIYTPMMIRILGKGEYGLYNTVASTMSMLSILSLGFNSSYIRFYTKYKQRELEQRKERRARRREGKRMPDTGEESGKRSIYKLNGLFLIVFLIIGAVALACGIFLTFNLDLVFKDGLVEAEYELARKLMILLTVNLTISFPMSVFSNIIAAHEKFIFLKTLAVIKTVGSPLLTIPLLFMGYGSLAIVFVTLIIAAAVDTTYLIFVLIKLKQKFIFHDFEKGLFKSLFFFTGFIAINMVVDQININIDKVLLGRFKGTEVVAVYSVGFTLYVYFQHFSTSLSHLFTPKVHSIVQATRNDPEQQKKRLTELFTRVGRIQFLILGLVASGLVFFGKEFIAHWAGSGYDDSYYVVLLLVLPSMIPLIQNIGIEIQRAQNNHKFRSIAYLLMAIINFVLSVFLCQLYGAVGSAIGTAISLIVANGFVINIYYHKRCNVDVLFFWKNILRMCLGLIIPVGAAVAAKFFIDFSSMPLLLAGMAGYTAIYCVSAWFLSTNRSEKALVLSALKKGTRIFGKIGRKLTGKKAPRSAG